MQPIARPRTLGFVIVLALVAGACTGSGPSSTASGEPAATTETGRASAQPVSRAESSSDAWLVVGRKDEPGLEVILAGTLERIYELPTGTPRKLWGQVIAATQADGTTVVDEIVVQPDLPAWRSRAIEGAWRLPRIGYDELPVGLSEDGSTIVLVEDQPTANATASRFAILADNDPARIIELPGSLEFDALSADGSILYVVEHLPGPPDAHYQVRAVDLPAGPMRDAVIVDKRNFDESMGGWPITQARHRNGVVFTLYRGAEHPFIHALNTAEAWAICLDLPEIGADDTEAAYDWGLATSSDGRAVYAVNATLGLASAIDPGDLSIRQTASFRAPRAAATITLAKFGHQDGGPVGRRVVVSPDGSTVFAAGAGGIVRLETDRLTAAGTLLPGAAVDALALTPDGSTLYALLRTDGRIVKVDAASGEVLGEVADAGFDRLVAIVPW